MTTACSASVRDDPGGFSSVIPGDLVFPARAAFMVISQ
jgi:hypothetical protein